MKTLKTLSLAAALLIGLTLQAQNFNNDDQVKDAQKQQNDLRILVLESGVIPFTVFIFTLEIDLSTISKPDQKSGNPDHYQDETSLSKKIQALFQPIIPDPFTTRTSARNN